MTGMTTKMGDISPLFLLTSGIGLTLQNLPSNIRTPTSVLVSFKIRFDPLSPVLFLIKQSCFLQLISTQPIPYARMRFIAFFFSACTIQYFPFPFSPTLFLQGLKVIISISAGSFSSNFFHPFYSVFSSPITFKIPSLHGNETFMPDTQFIQIPFPFILV